MEILIKELYSDVILPTYGSEEAAGFDLSVHNFKKYIDAGNDGSKLVYPSEGESLSCTMYPRSRLLVTCGFSIALPKGYVLDIRPRSGLALKQGITVLNSPGTVDSDYRGEIGVILINHSNDAITIFKGDRIAQAVILKHERAEFSLVEELPTTVRGENGYGSTGVTHSY